MSQPAIHTAHSQHSVIPISANNVSFLYAVLCMTELLYAGSDKTAVTGPAGSHSLHARQTLDHQAGPIDFAGHGTAQQIIARCLSPWIRGPPGGGGWGVVYLEDPFEEVPLAPREAPPVSHDDQRQLLPIKFLYGLGCLQSRVGKPYLTGLSNIAQ